MIKLSKRKFSVKVLTVLMSLLLTLSMIELLATASAPTTISASFTVSPDEGPSGTVATVKGVGFNESDTIQQGEVTINGWPIRIVGGSIPVNSTGGFEGQVVIPSLTLGDWDIEITDGINTASDNFTVNGETAIDVTPTIGPPGATINVQGFNFTRIPGTQVSLSFDGIKVAYATTASDGTFTCNFLVPAMPFQFYNITAIDANGLNATHSFKIDIILMIISPTSGPSGTAVTLTGTGFDANGNYNATFGDIMVIENGSITAQETLSDVFYVPTVAPGAYTLLVEDTADNKLETTFVVTETTSLTADPAIVSVGLNLTLTGENFAEKAGANLEFFVYNSTWSMNITGEIHEIDTLTDVTVSEHGNFTGYWTVSDLLIRGNTYTINATDDEGLYANATISLMEMVALKVEVKPSTLNLKSRGRWVTAFIKVPSGHDARDINISTVRLEVGSASIEAVWGIADEEVLMVKFSRKALQEAVSLGEVDVWVTGEFESGASFGSYDMIRVINPGKSSFRPNYNRNKGDKSANGNGKNNKPSWTSGKPKINNGNQNGKNQGNNGNNKGNNKGDGKPGKSKGGKK